MNKLIFSIATLLLIFDCSSDSDQIKSLEGTHINIDSLKSYIPLLLHIVGTKMIYKNLKGETRTLKIKYYKEFTQDYTSELFNYKSDVFTLEMIDDLSPNNLKISIHGSGNYNGTQLALGIFAILMPFNESGSMSGTILFKDGEPQVSPFDIFYSKLNLLGNSYNNVYVFTASNVKVYSELDINSEVGVVAFRDENNELWVFDKFE